MALNKKSARAISSFYHYRILAAVYRHPSITRERIAEETGLGASITYRHVGELRKKGLIRKSGLSASDGGRKTELLSINPKAGYLLGVACTKNKLTWVLSDLAGCVLQTKSEDLQGTEKSSAIIAKLSTGIKGLIARAKIRRSQILGAGVGLPGLLNAERSQAIANIHVGDWADIPIKEILMKEVKRPVFIESNSNLTALAESNFGLAQGMENFLSLNISNGVGMGIFIHHHLYNGVQGRAGEIGHVQIDPSGPLCCCGNRGCLESMISIPALVKQAKQSIKQGVFSSILQFAGGNPEAIDINAIWAAARGQDKLALNMMRAAAANLGLAIGNAINLLNPEIIILNGEIREAGDDFLPLLQQTVETVRFQPDTFSSIVFSNRPWPRAIAEGGIALVQQKIFIDREIDLLHRRAK